MTKQSVLWALGLLARQVSKAARRDSNLSDLADHLFAACVQCGVPTHLLPE